MHKSDPPRRPVPEAPAIQVNQFGNRILLAPTPASLAPKGAPPIPKRQLQLNVMVDLETLGTVPGSSILSIGAVAFDSNGLGAEFYIVINSQSCLDYGLRVSPETLAWWGNQSTRAKEVLIKASTSDIPLPIALNRFTNYLAQYGLKKVRVWGCGSDFDNALLASSYEAIGSKPPWPYYNNRCYRTLKNLNRAIKAKPSGTYHNALDDAKRQALHAIELLNHI
jgi:hypothetical protein